MEYKPAEIAVVLDVLIDEFSKRQPVDPIHFQNGKPLAANANAHFLVLEVHRAFEARRFKMFADPAVSFPLPGDLFDERRVPARQFREDLGPCHRFDAKPFHFQTGGGIRQIQAVNERDLCGQAQAQHRQHHVARPGDIADISRSAGNQTGLGRCGVGQAVAVECVDDGVSLQAFAKLAGGFKNLRTGEPGGVSPRTGFGRRGCWKSPGAHATRLTWGYWGRCRGSDRLGSLSRVGLFGGDSVGGDQGCAGVTLVVNSAAGVDQDGDAMLACGFDDATQQGGRADSFAVIGDQHGVARWQRA